MGIAENPPMRAGSNIRNAVSETSALVCNPLINHTNLVKFALC